MIISRTKSLRLNMGNYEHIDTSVTISGEFDDLPDANYLDALLLEYLRADLHQASLLTDNEESFVHPMLDLINPKKGTTK